MEQDAAAGVVRPGSDPVGINKRPFLVGHSKNGVGAAIDSVLLNERRSRVKC